MKRSVLILPATGPGDVEFNSGCLPEVIAARPALDIEMYAPGRLVWYTPEIRRDVLAAARFPRCDAVIGFSKSGLGAVNLALEHPGRFGEVFIFDSPVTETDRARYGAERFYATDKDWLADLPAERAGLIASSGLGGRLHLLAGPVFGGQMRDLAGMIPGCRLHDFTGVGHRWDPEWLGFCLDAISR